VTTPEQLAAPGSCYQKNIKQQNREWEEAGDEVLIGFQNFGFQNFSPKRSN